MFFRLIKTDFKRITGYGIYMIIAAFVIMSVLLGLAIKADDILYSDDDQTPLNIGIVMSADSKNGAHGLLNHRGHGQLPHIMRVH